jgi:hypothetical protein
MADLDSKSVDTLYWEKSTRSVWDAGKFCISLRLKQYRSDDSAGDAIVDEARAWEEERERSKLR